MQLTWIDAENPDPRDVAAAVALQEAVRLVDWPHQEAPTATAFVAGLRHGWDGDPSSYAIARDDRGRAIGLIEVALPTWDNTHFGYVEATVDPERRGEGIGRELYSAGVARVREAGRRLVISGAYADSPGDAFARAVGMERGIVEVKRRQYLPRIDMDTVEQAYASALEHATGYEIVRLAGPTPDDMVEAIVELTSAINDAPIDDLDIEDEVFSPERLRAFEAGQELYRRRWYRVVAREKATGALGGHTVVGVSSEQPAYGWQYDTSVLRAHRGHRLGLLLKADMMRWLIEEEPQLRTIDTWNAQSNAHMIKVNEMLGYEILQVSHMYQQAI